MAPKSRIHRCCVISETCCFVVSQVVVPRASYECASSAGGMTVYGELPTTEKGCVAARKQNQKVLHTSKFFVWRRLNISLQPFFSACSGQLWLHSFLRELIIALPLSPPFFV